MKVMILGHPGCGKSTMAQALNKKYNIDILYLDQVRFKENWIEREMGECEKLVGDFLKKDSWIIDGNFSKVYYEERFNDADYIIYLNYPRVVCFYRIIKRWFKHRKSPRSSVSAGCNEKLDLEFMYFILIKSRLKSRLKRFKNIQNKYSNKFYEIKNNKELDKFMEVI